MYERFLDANLYVYNTANGVLLDGVIWCLGPIVDDSRPYGPLRRYLAAATCSICRCFLRVDD